MPISTVGLSTAQNPSHPGYISGLYYILQTHFVSDSTSQSVFIPNTITYTPIEIFHDVSINRLGINCTTSKTGADARYGLYSNENGRPKDLLFDSGNISCQTNGFKESVANLQLSKGWYWFAGICTIAPFLSVITSYMGSNAILGQSTPSALNINSLLRHTQASAFNALPSVAPLSNVTFINGSVIPIIWIKIA